MRFVPRRRSRAPGRAAGIRRFIVRAERFAAARTLDNGASLMRARSRASCACVCRPRWASAGSRALLRACDDAIAAAVTPPRGARGVIARTHIRAPWQHVGCRAHDPGLNRSPRGARALGPAEHARVWGTLCSSTAQVAAAAGRAHPRQRSIRTGRERGSAEATVCVPVCQPDGVCCALSLGDGDAPLSHRILCDAEASPSRLIFFKQLKQHEEYV